MQTPLFKYRDDFYAVQYTYRLYKTKRDYTQND